MNLVLVHGVLAVLWCLLWGSMSAVAVVGGLVVGFVVLWLYSRAVGRETYYGMLARRVRFGLYFLKILILANVQIAREVMRRTPSQTPRIIRYDVSGLSKLQLVTFASSITLTPGTLVIDVSEDRRFLYVHCMYAKDRDKAVGELDELKRRLLTEVF